MNNYTCEYAKIIKQGIYEKIICLKDNTICPFVRYCTSKKSIEHNDMAIHCLKKS